MAFNQFDKWKSGLNDAMKNLTGSAEIKAKFTADSKNNKPKTDFDKLLTEFGTQFMQHFFVEEVFKPAFFYGRGIGSGGGASSPLEFMPKIDLGYSEVKKHFTWSQGEGSPTETTDNLVGKWDSGFGMLFAAMTQLGPARRGGNSVRIDMGPRSEILKQKLGQYSVSSGAPSASAFDSFFFAAEFGTGIAENVGGSQWVREVKKNNAQNGPLRTESIGVDALKGPPGSWWFGSEKSGGGRFSGQRGLHFLFDAVTRNPLPIYGQWVRNNIRPKFAEFMAARTKGKVRAS